MSGFLPRLPRRMSDLGGWLIPGLPGSSTDVVGQTLFPHEAASVPPPGEPVPVDTSVADREVAREAAEKRRRSSAGRTGSNPTGGFGDASTPNLAAKSLLGT